MSRTVSPTQIPMLKPYPQVPQNVFRDRAFKEAVKVFKKVIGVGPNPT